MLLTDPRFKSPAWNAKIWRYMSFEKFLDLMFSKTLYFSNLSKLTDKREAEIPQKNFQILNQKFINDFGNKEMGEKEFFRFHIDIRRRINSSFVNCWIVSPDESYALWKIYLDGGKTGVAIKTNTKNLKEAINSVDNSEEMFMGKIEYSDFITKEITLTNLLTTKRKAYSYENECRLLILKEPEFKKTAYGEELITKDGLRININPDKLIQSIFISPFANKTFRNSFKLVIEGLFPSMASKIELSTIRDQ